MSFALFEVGLRHNLMTKEIIISSALRTLTLQANAVKALNAFINDDFVKAVEGIVASKGRLVVS